MVLKEVIVESGKDFLGETRAQGLLYSSIWLGCSIISRHDTTVDETGGAIVSGLIGSIGLFTAYHAIKPRTEEQLWQVGLDKYKKWAVEKEEA